MTSEIRINIGKTFSRFPIGRKREHGEASGEEFRESVLVPAFEQGAARIIIELDDALGYGSSFLDEAFGGLVRRGLSRHRVLDTLHLVSDDLSLIDEIRTYISDAKGHDS